jgi:hypothetical protein
MKSVAAIAMLLVIELVPDVIYAQGGGKKSCPGGLSACIDGCVKAGGPDVRSRGHLGPDMLKLSCSPFAPQQTSGRSLALRPAAFRITRDSRENGRPDCQTARSFVFAIQQ